MWRIPNRRVARDTAVRSFREISRHRENVRDQRFDAGLVAENVIAARSRHPYAVFGDYQRLPVNGALLKGGSPDTRIRRQSVRNRLR